jgi:hypothetical protein
VPNNGACLTPVCAWRQALERQRLKRMRGAGGDDSGSDLDDAAAPLGGYALRRHKAARTVRPSHAIQAVMEA